MGKKKRLTLEVQVIFTVDCHPKLHIYMVKRIKSKKKKKYLNAFHLIQCLRNYLLLSRMVTSYYHQYQRTFC